ncbi:MAG: alpha-1,4-glucan--maltose-1-phosphate maltosyltransferase [Acidobacteria bacterium]|nr:alpha-1,4-glucan--maltose-1-phosphate maltosyltransferase [Acidobacteriota bacterium]
MDENCGRCRVVIEGVQPQIDGGRFPIKRVNGETVQVQADIFADGHDKLSCRLLYRHQNDDRWLESPMQPAVNDRWQGEFRVSDLGRYLYTVEAWVDSFRTWRTDLMKRLDAQQDVSIDLLIGAGLVESAAQRAGGPDANRLREGARLMREGASLEARTSIALDDELARLVSSYPEYGLATRFEKELVVVVDREKARFSSWYELFPRSCSGQPGRHGTFRDCANWLPYIASMGFDVLYLPPIHPIGRQFRKGKNNVVTATASDVGSPWAIGSEEGGHKAIHPGLGTLEDFRYLIAKAEEFGIEIALDIALQCTPDHPYVREHPEWFRKRPDGCIQYAENPPKKYQDIYPINFETENWPALWQELKSVLEFWLEQGARIFRVDNPHTKSFYLWEWVIGKIKESHPEVIFLAEAFTRPRVMYRLAKLGFSQSYTYFTWRNTKEDLTDYFRELTCTAIKEYFRPNLWPNTPDILPEYLQVGGRPAFMVRLVLAATLGSNYGIYGPAFELCENTPLQPGSEEYLDSEKYELKVWDVKSPRNLKDFIARVNSIRRENPALQRDRTLRFHATDNPLLLCYSKASEDLSNVIVVVVNLDAFHRQVGWINLDLESLGLHPRQAFQAHDLLSGGRFLWSGSRNYVELVPDSLPAHIFRLRKRLHTEKDFDYYL